MPETGYLPVFLSRSKLRTVPASAYHRYCYPVVICERFVVVAWDARAVFFLEGD